MSSCDVISLFSVVTSLHIRLFTAFLFSKFKKYFDGFSPYSIHLILDLIFIPSIFSFLNDSNCDFFSFNVTNSLFLSVLDINAFSKSTISFSKSYSKFTNLFFFLAAYEIVSPLIIVNNVSKNN